MKRFAVLFLLVAWSDACALQGGTINTGPAQKVYSQIDQATRDKWTPTCNDIWIQELGRPIDAAALPDCITRIVNGFTSEDIRAIVRKSDEYGLHQKAIEAAKKAADDAAAEAAKHVDPSKFSLGELAAIRGAMWPLGTASSCGAVPLGPRPGQADNVIATVFITGYPAEVQDCIIAELKARGYTHVVMGPLVDSDGYHGIWQPNDWRGANFERFLDAAQKFWDKGLAPVVFIKPDNWPLVQAKAELTPLLNTARARRLLRIVVPMGWEAGAGYEYSSCTWADAGRWMRDTLPDALVMVHMVSDRDAPAGTDALCNDDDHAWNPGGNAAAWARVAPFYHGWLTQSNAFDKPTGTGGDREHPELTNFQNWQRQFNPSVRGSYRDRFEHGYAGWPTFSAWGQSIPLLVYAGEFKAYWTFWQHRTEAEGVMWGDAAMTAGAAGYLDSGSVPVPVRR